VPMDWPVDRSIKQASNRGGEEEACDQQHHHYRSHHHRSPSFEEQREKRGASLLFVSLWVACGGSIHPLIPLPPCPSSLLRGGVVDRITASRGGKGGGTLGGFCGSVLAWLLVCLSVGERRGGCSVSPLSFFLFRGIKPSGSSRAHTRTQKDTRCMHRSMMLPMLLVVVDGGEGARGMD
jgi:hypothetical protein